MPARSPHRSSSLPPHRLLSLHTAHSLPPAPLPCHTLAPPLPRRLSRATHPARSSLPPHRPMPAPSPHSLHTATSLAHSPPHSPLPPLPLSTPPLLLSLPSLHTAHPFPPCPSPVPHTMPAPHLSRLTAPPSAQKIPHAILPALYSPTATLQPLLIRPVASGAASRRNFSP